MSPLLKSVEKAGHAGMIRKRNPMKVSSTDFFLETELVRKEFAALINARESNRIALVPSVSYGLANVARNVKLVAGNKIIVAAGQFPSNYYPWDRLARESGAKVVAVTPQDSLLDRGKGWNERLLEAIDVNTRIVALGHVHWADGTRFDLAAIRKRSSEVGALLILDGTQSVGALRLDVQKIRPDALVCAGYKWLMGPYSIGLAYYGEYFDSGIPIEDNWINRRNSENFTGLVNYQEAYQPGALRYEVGEHSNFILVPMLLEALKQINHWKPENIQDYCGRITATAIHQLRDHGCWVEDRAYRGNHLFGIRFSKGVDLELVREELKRRKISVSFRGDSMRVSPHVYNNENDFAKLIAVLKKAW